MSLASLDGCVNLYDEADWLNQCQRTRQEQTDEDRSTDKSPVLCIINKGPEALWDGGSTSGVIFAGNTPNGMILELRKTKDQEKGTPTGGSRCKISKSIGYSFSNSWKNQILDDCT